MTTKGVQIAMTKKRKRQLRNGSNSERTATPSLRFTPTAWAKLLFLRDYGDTEVGGFGIAASDDLLLVEDVQLVKQVCSWAHVAFDDESVADFFDQQVDAGRRPEQFARIWVHTHPGDCPRPSMTDEETYARVFGRSDWAVMFILACEGQSYARLRFNVGPRADVMIPTCVDYTQPFGGCEPDGWEQEYLENIQPHPTIRGTSPVLEPVIVSPLDEDPTDDWYENWFDYAGDHENVKGFVT
jgi:proteasome lid subunit RPN8/RPN11